MPLYTKLLGSLCKGASFGDNTKLLVFDLTPYDGMLQQTAAEHYARPIGHVPPFALITCLWPEIMVRENATKIRAFCEQYVKHSHCGYVEAKSGGAAWSCESTAANAWRAAEGAQRDLQNHVSDG